MKNKEDNPKNVFYSTYIDGTGNLTTVQGAPVIATKGHYIDFSTKPEHKDVLPIMVQPNGQLVQQVDADDEVIL
jgi:hypothetical protein